MKDLFLSIRHPIRTCNSQELLALLSKKYELPINKEIPFELDGDNWGKSSQTWYLKKVRFIPCQNFIKVDFIISHSNIWSLICIAYLITIIFAIGAILQESVSVISAENILKIVETFIAWPILIYLYSFTWLSQVKHRVKMSLLEIERKLGEQR
ncbi:MAG TPA: hypothetical protein VI911_05805 [Patescibacteria group bacterium]|nr:MAG: hypothetical protein A2417_15905 [Bdellovibrionales bacterium RIFOXYC1_FULL_37_79]OFZ57495.1 MAG: hypothetical protein A2381_05545 [Bdellovibrionales bacterium RIFOXYB1_FULL_37_110]OFZ63183.1 MAG: hypothetical protein A2577_08940 [Bdellovibrionales bacterium RIFOXYD1_FULL_36_51]HLD90516.1 hypothetical protein [Patescibacteria group bacterium]